MSYGRRLSLKIGTLGIEAGGRRDLRVAAAITRSQSRDPNDAVIQIWNLHPNSRAELEGASRIFAELRAGYEDETIDTLFEGVLLDCVSRKEGPDMVTTVTLGDDAEQKAAMSLISRAFPIGSPVLTVLRELIKASGLDGSNLAQISRDARINGKATLDRPFVAAGSALNALHAFARSTGFQYTIQNRSVIFLGTAQDATLGPLITSENAEQPSIDAEGLVNFTCRLVPELIPGRPFQLDTSVKGDYVAQSTKHRIDTWGNDWSVDVTGELLSAMIERIKKDSKATIWVPKSGGG